MGFKDGPGFRVATNSRSMEVFIQPQPESLFVYLYICPSIVTVPIWRREAESHAYLFPRYAERL
jgi:hypothetical protein